MTKPERPARLTRGDFRTFVPVQTRWHDNDLYGHVNNVVYYAWFDTAVNGLLIDAGVLDAGAGETIGLVVETRCAYFASLKFPEPVEIGVRVIHIGKSSVRYCLGAFAQGADAAAAQGEFTHVYVARASRKPAPIPPATVAFLETLR
jgi:acyl-CoA thioester hydrolase